MPFSRRDFMGLTSAALVAGASRPTHSVAAESCDCREDFPVLQESTYLNSAYIAPSPQSVVDEVVAFHQAKASNPIQLGSMLDETVRCRTLFAQLINAETAEIGMLSTTSEGENVVTNSLNLQRGDNVVIDSLHYNTTVFLYDHLAKTNGIEVRVVNAVNGASPPEAFEALVDENTRIVSVAWVSHQNGYLHDLAALAEIAHAHGAYLYADAIQGIGAVALNVKETGVDFLTCGGYKWLLAGFGVAPFYVRGDLLDEIEMDRVGWRQLERVTDTGEREFFKDARKFGYATPAFGSVYQMRAALDYVLAQGVASIEDRTASLAIRLNEGLRAVGFDVVTPRENRSPIVAFKHGAEPQAVGDALANAGISVSMREGGHQVRAGIALFNNEDDIDHLLEVVSQFAG